MMTYDGSHGGETQSEFPEFRELPTWINFMITDEVTPNQLPELKQSRNNGLFLEVVHSIAEVFGHFFLSHVVSSRAFATEVFLLFPSLFTCLDELSTGCLHDTSVAGELNSLISSCPQQPAKS